MEIPFSIIIPSFRGSEKLSQTLSQLDLLECPKNAYEVIVVSNDPKDSETLQLVKSLQRKWKNISYVSEQKRGAGPSRNTGVQHAKYQHLIFLDDDVQVKASFLKGYEAAWIKYPRARIIGGKIFAQPSGMKVLTHGQQRLLQSCPWCFGQLDRGDRDEVMSVGGLVYSGNMSYRRESLRQKSVFHPLLGVLAFGNGRIGAEDFEVCTRSILRGEDVVYVADPRISVTNEVEIERFTDEYVTKRHFFAGIEIALQEQCLRKEFPSFKSFYTSYLKTWEGLRLLLSHKYERKMLFSYLLNRKYFIPKEELIGRAEK